MCDVWKGEIKNMTNESLPPIQGCDTVAGEKKGNVKRKERKMRRKKK